jgi:autotransporter-associated beta strand protein
LIAAVQDSGLAGRYPLRSAQAAVTISLASTNDPVVWLGNGLDNNWATAGNWSGLASQEGAWLLFGKPLRQANVNNLAAFTPRSLQLTNGGFTLSGNPLTLQAGLTNAGTNTLTLLITLDAAQTWLNSSGTLTLSGPVTNAGFNLNLIANADIRLDGSLTGAGGLIKSGPSRLLLQGTHTYTGPTTVSAASGTTTALETTGASDLDLSGSSLVMNGRMDLWNHNATVGSLNGNGLIFANNWSTTIIPFHWRQLEFASSCG